MPDDTPILPLPALKAALRSKCSDADESLWVATEGKTRICTTLVSADSGEATEIVEVLFFDLRMHYLEAFIVGQFRII